MENPYDPSKAKPLAEAPQQWRTLHIAINIGLILLSGLFALSQLVKIFTDFDVTKIDQISFLFYLFRIIFFVLMTACCILLAKHNKSAQWTFVALALAMIISAYTVHFAGMIAIAYAIFGVAFSRYATRVGLFT